MTPPWVCPWQTHQAQQGRSRCPLGLVSATVSTGRGGSRNRPLPRQRRGDPPARAPRSEGKGWLGAPAGAHERALCSARPAGTLANCLRRNKPLGSPGWGLGGSRCGRQAPRALSPGGALGRGTGFWGCSFWEAPARTSATSGTRGHHGLRSSETFPHTCRGPLSQAGWTPRCPCSAVGTLALRLPPQAVTQVCPHGTAHGL